MKKTCYINKMPSFTNGTKKKTWVNGNYLGSWFKLNIADPSPKKACNALENMDFVTKKNPQKAIRFEFFFHFNPQWRSF